MEERLHSLQRGLDNLTTAIDHLERKLDEQTDVFQRLRGDLEHLETKIYHVTSTTTDTRCSVHTEENQNHEARYNAKFNNVTESATRIQSDRLKSIETNRWWTHVLLGYAEVLMHDLTLPYFAEQSVISEWKSHKRAATRRSITSLTIVLLLKINTNDNRIKKLFLVDAYAVTLTINDAVLLRK